MYFVPPPPNFNRLRVVEHALTLVVEVIRSIFGPSWGFLHDRGIFKDLDLPPTMSKTLSTVMLVGRGAGVSYGTPSVLYTLCACLND